MMSSRPATSQTQRSSRQSGGRPSTGLSGRGGGMLVPSSSSSATPTVYLTHFTCNNCSNLLSGTVYQTACDCVFCEDCTWRHFEKSSDCPKCGRVLGEDDFTELVVGTMGVALKKACIQSMLNVEGHGVGETVPPSFAEGCKSLMRALDVFKSSTHFLLRQMVMSSNEAMHTASAESRRCQALKIDLDNTKRRHAGQMQQMMESQEALEAKLTGRDHDLHKWKQACEDQQRKLHNVEQNGSSAVGNRGSSHNFTRATPTPTPTPSTSGGRLDYYGMDVGATASGQRSVGGSTNSLSRFKGPSSSSSSIRPSTSNLGFNHANYSRPRSATRPGSRGLRGEQQRQHTPGLYSTGGQRIRRTQESGGRFEAKSPNEFTPSGSGWGGYGR
ncbi:hypothetical protein TrCOL_g1029 [Triparma columacea]|uniref:RING-type domain-containing protein n=1 Tax=Triparma columacea TaxID=722753 RepID=A0A9W7FXV8_9STRA|nr:hypothetical protein TrCOL_g1029 [Triparma columacea]